MRHCSCYVCSICLTLSSASCRFLLSIEGFLIHSSAAFLCLNCRLFVRLGCPSGFNVAGLMLRFRPLLWLLHETWQAGNGFTRGFVISRLLDTQSMSPRRLPVCHPSLSQAASLSPGGMTSVLAHTAPFIYSFLFLQIRKTLCRSRVVFTLFTSLCNMVFIYENNVYESIWRAYFVEKTKHYHLQFDQCLRQSTASVTVQKKRLYHCFYPPFVLHHSQCELACV